MDGRVEPGRAAFGDAPRLTAGGRPLRVLICSGGQYESQANAQVRLSIMDGWEACVGAGNVFSASITGACAVIADVRPDLVLGIGSYLPESTYFGEVSRDARRQGAVLAFWATEDPYEKDASYRIEHDFDAVFCCDRWGARFYDHPRADHLLLAGCHKRHYVPLDAAAPRPIDVLFCGVAFTSRKELVEDLRPCFAGLNVCFVGPGWGAFGVGFSDRRIEKAELIALYGQSKVVLNLGRSLHFENRRYQITPSSPGPRTFEAALAGSVQLFHEDTHEIRDYFTAGEMPTFSSLADFEPLLRARLSDAAGSAAIAAAAQRRALAEHTYVHRARQIVSRLRQWGLLGEVA